MRKSVILFCILYAGNAACLELNSDDDIEGFNEVLSADEVELTAYQHISYRAHVQSYGWQSWVYDPSMAGTAGQKLRLEAIQIAPTGISNFGVCYQASVAGYGLQPPACNGATAGTTGESRQMRELTIWLSPYTTTNCRLQYRVHVASLGWLNWVSETMSAGCPTCWIQAIEIRFEDRNCI